MLFLGKLENPEFRRNFKEPVFCQFKAIEDCPNSEYNLKMIRELPKSPEHPRQTIELSKMF